MSDEVLRRPRTFWQWLTNQPGSIYQRPTVTVAPPPAPRTALDALEAQLSRVHSELNSFNSIEGVETKGYLALVSSLDKLHEELVRRSKEESSGQSRV